MMTIKTENWLGEFVSTIGTGDAILGGAIDGFAGFSNVGDDVDVYYTIIDGLDKETGIGTLTGGKLVRKDIHATLVDGAYVKNGSAINLSGNAQVYGTANAHFLDYVQAVSNAEIVNTQAIAELKSLQINGHALTASFNLTAADVGAHPDSWMPSTEALNVYQKDASDIRYIKTQDAEQVAGLVMRVGGARDQQLQQSINEALLRSYAEAGYNLVDGSFETGGTLVNTNDVLLQESTGKAFTGPAGPVAAGTNPASGGFIDRSNDIIRRYASIESMTADHNIVVGNELSTGGSKWRAVSTTTPLALQNGLYAELIGDLYIGDFSSNHVQQLNAYITPGIAGSYATRALAEAYKYSMKPVTVVFNVRVTSPVPLLLMHHVKYQRVGSGMYFNRAMRSGLHYAPSNLDSCATEPVVFELSGGSFVRKAGVLIGTPDNPVGGDSDYITMSDGCDVSFDVTTATGVKVGFNFACCPGITGDRPSMGVAEQAGDAISVPKVAMLLCKSWTHSIYKPMLRSSQQSIVYSEANAGGKVTQPYCQRDGSMLSTAVPYSFAEAVSAGKNGSTAITILGAGDFNIDTPVLEKWKYPIAAKNADVRISEPHIEGDVAEHNVVLLDSYIDIDNWSGMLATGTGEMFHSLGQDGTDRAVILRGMPMRLGPMNGIVGGTYTRAFLIIEDISGAVADYGKMGDWAAVRRLDMSIARSIYIDAVAGSDTNMGLTSTRPVKTMSTAIRILNTVNRMAPAHGVTDINLKSDVTIDTVTRAYKPFVLWGAFTLTAQAAAYIELYNCGMVQLIGTTINAAAAAVIRHVAGNNTILCASSTVTGVAIAQTSGSGSVHMNVNNSVTTGIAKYLDGSGSTALSLMVNGGSRNTAIDANPAGTAQLVLGTKYV